jgi:hypothetical protein
MHLQKKPEISLSQISVIYSDKIVNKLLRIESRMNCKHGSISWANSLEETT